LLTSLACKLTVCSLVADLFGCKLTVCSLVADLFGLQAACRQSEC